MILILYINNIRINEYIFVVLGILYTWYINVDQKINFHIKFKAWIQYGNIIRNTQQQEYIH